MEGIVTWITATPVNTWVLDNEWVWPTLETLHFFGLCLLLGSLLIIDMRMIGWLKRIDISATNALLPLVFIGFFINLITGVLFFFGDPARYIINIAFQLKMLLVILSGLNALFYYWKIYPVIAYWGSLEQTPLIGKFSGSISLLFWFGVLIFGRMIPYMGTG